MTIPLERQCPERQGTETADQCQYRKAFSGGKLTCYNHEFWEVVRRECQRCSHLKERQILALL